MFADNPFLLLLLEEHSFCVGAQDRTLRLALRQRQVMVPTIFIAFRTLIMERQRHFTSIGEKMNTESNHEIFMDPSRKEDHRQATPTVHMERTEDQQPNGENLDREEQNSYLFEQTEMKTLPRSRPTQLYTRKRKRKAKGPNPLSVKKKKKLQPKKNL